MNEFTWFSLALIATFFWGLSDVTFKRGTDPDDPYSHLRILIMIGIMMGIQAFFELYKLYSNGLTYSIRTGLIYFPISFLYILSMGVDFYGYRYLRISVGSPVASTSGAIAGLLAYKVLKKPMTGIQFFEIILIAVGLIALAYMEHLDSKKEKLSKKEIAGMGAAAFIFPVTYAIVDSIATFLDDVYLTKYLTEEEALISFEMTFLIVALIALFYLVVIKKQEYKLKNEKFNMLGGIFETAGQFFYVYALSGNSVVSAPVMSLDGIVATVIGGIWLKEKLSKKQYATIAMIGVGVFILGFFE